MIPGSQKWFQIMAREFGTIILLSVTNSFGSPNCEKIFWHWFITAEDCKFFEGFNDNKLGMTIVNSNVYIREKDLQQFVSCHDLELGG